MEMTFIGLRLGNRLLKVQNDFFYLIVQTKYFLFMMFSDEV